MGIQEVRVWRCPRTKKKILRQLEREFQAASPSPSPRFRPVRPRRTVAMLAVVIGTLAAAWSCLALWAPPEVGVGTAAGLGLLAGAVALRWSASIRGCLRRRPRT